MRARHSVLHTSASPHLTRVRTMLVPVLLALMLCLQTACGSRASAPQPLRVGLVTSLADLGDSGLNDLTYAGLQRAEKTLGASVSVAQPQALGDIAPAMRRDIQSGDNVIVGVGDQMEYAAAQMAQLHPNVTFVLIDAMPLAGDALQYTLQLPNVASLYFNDQQAGALAGGFAALLLQQHEALKHTASPPAGIFSTGPVPATSRFILGFQWGMHYMLGQRTQLPPHLVKVTYTANASHAARAAACRQAVAHAAQTGARLLLGLNGACQQAAIAVADAQHLPCLGVYTNQQGHGACVVGSVTEHADDATYSMLAAIAHHNFTSGMHSYDLASGDIALITGSAQLAPTAETRLQRFEQQLRTHALVPAQYHG